MSENDLAKEINREELKRWAIEEIKKTGLKNTTIRFGKVSKKWHGTTNTKIIDGEKHFVITIHKGENLEELKDELDVEMFKDTVKHDPVDCRFPCGRKESMQLFWERLYS